MRSRVQVDAPAKVNLWLRILAREASGFHSLETLFCALSLCDTVTVEHGGEGIALEVLGGAATGPPEQNLAMRAARAWERAAGVPLQVRIRLQKRIPAGAGLGGGSSDAAATLRALDALHDQPLGAATLLRLGGELGSDVPFFLCGSPLALGWGRGERLLALPPLPTRPLLLAHPGQPIATADAYRLLAESRLDGRDSVRTSGGSSEPVALPAEALRSWSAIAGVATNDFGLVAGRLVPGIPAALELLREAGAEIALLAGSGSAVFGTFADTAPRDQVATVLRSEGWSTWSAATLETIPQPVDQP